MTANTSEPATACVESCVYQRMVFWLVVGAQVLLAASIVLTVRAPFHDILPPTALLCGLMLGLWAMIAMGRRHLNMSPRVRTDARLVARGPYRFIRHPKKKSTVKRLGLCCGRACNRM